MFQKIFTIRDNKLGVFNTPFFHPAEIIAIRSLAMAMADKSLQLSFFPEDYDLYLLGEYNDASGEIKIEKQPKFITSAVTIKQMENNRLEQQLIESRKAMGNAQTLPSKEKQNE